MTDVQSSKTPTQASEQTNETPEQTCQTNNQTFATDSANNPSPSPTPTQYTYAVLQEFNGEENESWMYFIRYQGNEEALKYLKDQFGQVEWYILDDQSIFDLDLKNLVSEQTAKEMIRVEVNECSLHRKFDGKLQMINLNLDRCNKNDKKLNRIYKILGKSKIDSFIDGEDRLVDLIYSDPESASESGSECESHSDSSCDHPKTVVRDRLKNKIKARQEEAKNEEEKRQEEKKLTRQLNEQHKQKVEHQQKKKKK
jgi:hypothetical protein